MSASRLNQSTVERVDASVQTWSVVVAEQEARKARLSEFAGAPAHINIKQAPLFLLFLSDLSRAERLAREVGRPHTGLHFLETFPVSVIDAGLAAQNAVVALESLDLGAVISAQCETRRMKRPRNSACRPMLRQYSVSVSGVPIRLLRPRSSRVCPAHGSSRDLPGPSTGRRHCCLR